MQQRVQQHRAVTIRQNETVAVKPIGIRRVVLQVIGPQDLRNICHAHGRAGMPGVGLLDGIDGKEADGIG